MVGVIDQPAFQLGPRPRNGPKLCSVHLFNGNLAKGSQVTFFGLGYSSCSYIGSDIAKIKGILFQDTLPWLPLKVSKWSVLGVIRAVLSAPRAPGTGAGNK
jgi:hypothetical protein